MPPGVPPRQSRPGGRVGLVVAALALAFLLAGAAVFLGYRNRAPDQGSLIASVAKSALRSKPQKATPAPLGIEYHFDRNAVLDSRVVGDRLLALTISGHVLAFDTKGLNPLAERLMARRVVCLGPADSDGVMAGVTNGSVVHIDAADLKVRMVGQVPGRPVWIGRRATGSLLVAYANPDHVAWGTADGAGHGHRISELDSSYQVAVEPATTFLLDKHDRLWMGSDGGLSGASLRAIQLGDGRSTTIKLGRTGLRGLAEMEDGQVWAFGGSSQGSTPASFLMRVEPGSKPVTVWSAPARASKPDDNMPRSPINGVIDAGGRVLVDTDDDVLETDRAVTAWRRLGSMGLRFAADRASSAGARARGQMHVMDGRWVMSLARGGFLDVTAEGSRRHFVEGQDSVLWPLQILPAEPGLEFSGIGGSRMYVEGHWRDMPELVPPPRELMGSARVEGEERVWAAIRGLRVDGTNNVIVAKAGPPRHYEGHLHGLKDVFVTGKWQGGEFAVLSQEDTALEPDDTFASPNGQLWSVDDQGLWSFFSGKWRMVMATGGTGHCAGPGGALHGRGAAVRSAIGEPLRFVEGVGPPWVGLPVGIATWAMAKLDPNEAGGAPLISDVPVPWDGVRVQVRDAISWTNGQLLLATNHGLCVFDLRWGTCRPISPKGLDGEVGLLLRDHEQRIWAAGRGLWWLESESSAHEMRSAIPMLSEADVTALGEAPDGRIALGLAGRGAILISIPPRYFQQAAAPTAPAEAWEDWGTFEGRYSDQALLVSSCSARPEADGRQANLRDGLLELVEKELLAGEPRAHLGEEAVFDRSPAVAVYASDVEKVQAVLLPALRTSQLWPDLRVSKRVGPPGSRVVDIKSCTAPVH